MISEQGSLPAPVPTPLHSTNRTHVSIPSTPLFCPEDGHWPVTAVNHTAVVRDGCSMAWRRNIATLPWRHEYAVKSEGDYFRDCIPGGVWGRTTDTCVKVKCPALDGFKETEAGSISDAIPDALTPAWYFGSELSHTPITGANGGSSLGPATSMRGARAPCNPCSEIKVMTRECDAMTGSWSGSVTRHCVDKSALPVLCNLRRVRLCSVQPYNTHSLLRTEHLCPPLPPRACAPPVAP